jgi:hypothetical protein
LSAEAAYSHCPARQGRTASCRRPLAENNKHDQIVEAVNTIFEIDGQLPTETHPPRAVALVLVGVFEFSKYSLRGEKQRRSAA